MNNIDNELNQSEVSNSENLTEDQTNEISSSLESIEETASKIIEQKLSESVAVIEEEIADEVMDEVRESEAEEMVQGLKELHHEDEAIVMEEDTPLANDDTLEEDVKELVTEHETILAAFETEEPVLEEIHQEDEVFETAAIATEGLSKRALLDIVKNALKSPESRTSNTNVNEAKNEFRRIIIREKKEALENYKAEGKDIKLFEPVREEIDHEFESEYKLFKKKRAEWAEAQTKSREINLAKKLEILDKMKAVTEDTESNTSFEDFKKLAEEWKTLGPVPLANSEKVWNRYQAYMNKIYDQRALYSEMMDMDRKKNYEIKLIIVAGIEALLHEEDMIEVGRLLRQYQEDWRKNGPVPREFSDELYNRFQNAVMLIVQKRNAYSEELNELRQHNYEAKLEILERIKEFETFEGTNLNSWVVKDKELNEWLNKWRGITEIPYDKRDELRTAFTESISVFNKNKNEFFKELKREQSDNLTRKIGLCERMEIILKEDDYGPFRREVIELQNDWKKSGPVPPKHSEKIWKRFREACDLFFTNLSERALEQEKEFKDNLEAKNLIINEAELLAKQETIEDPDTIVREFQTKFNEIGHVPFKEKEKVRKRFYDALSGIMAKRKYTGRKENNKGYGQDNHRQHTGNRNQPEREQGNIGMLQREYKQIESEVITLENNMEFLGRSSGSQALKMNIQGQVDRLKEKMKELQAQMKPKKVVEKKSEETNVDGAISTQATESEVKTATEQTSADTKE